VGVGVGVGVGTTPFWTLTLIRAVPRRQVLSLAVTVIVCHPLENGLVSTRAAQVDVPVAMISGALSTATTTLVSRLLSHAVPETLTTPETDADAEGDAMWTLIGDQANAV
jgi:hypothetical protein